MALRALPEALHRLVTKARASRRGIGLCPHCHRFQRFMVANSRGRRGIWGLVPGAVAGIIVGGTVSSRLAIAQASEIGLGAGLATIVAVVMGIALTGLRRGPHPYRLAPESLTDGEIDERLAAPRVAEGADPVLLWAQAAWPKWMKAEHLVGLGFSDFTGEEGRFGRFDTEEILRPIEEEGLGYRQREEE